MNDIKVQLHKKGQSEVPRRYVIIALYCRTIGGESRVRRAMSDEDELRGLRESSLKLLQTKTNCILKTPVHLEQETYNG